MENEVPEIRLCSNCHNEILGDGNFCRNCGQAHNHEEVAYYSNKWKNLQQVALFFAIEIVLCVSGYLIEDITLNISLFYDLTFAVASVWFFTANWQENKILLKWPNFSFPKLIGLIVATIIASFIVQLLVGYLNEFVFQKDYSFYFVYAGHEYGNYIMIVSVALFPALFEELAYRGFLMQKLLRVVETREAIYITTILFFLIHFSMISFFWMLPFAFLLAYVRIKTNTLWYGVVMHFFFNLTACLVEIYTYGSF